MEKKKGAYKKMQRAHRRLEAPEAQFLRVSVNSMGPSLYNVSAGGCFNGRSKSIDLTVCAVRRHAPCVCGSGRRKKEAMASPIVKRGTLEAQSHIYSRIPVLIELETIANIINTAEYRTLQCDSISIARQYSTLNRGMGDLLKSLRN